MFTILTYIAVFIFGVILGILFGRSNPKKSDAIYAAAKGAEAEAEAIIKKTKEK